MSTGTQSHSKRARNLILFVGCALAWFIFDRVVKTIIDSQYEKGDVFVDSVLGLFQFRLVHNTGAAWGSFENWTPIIAAISAVICIAILIAAFVYANRANVIEMISLALIFAGGLGNLFDRVTQGYVVDFISTTFINFPTFNIADIGVTCGMFVLLICVIIRTFKEDAQHGSQS